MINAPLTFGPMAKGTAVPLGLAYIASYLKKKGIDIGAIDMAYEKCAEKDFKEYLLKYTPQIIGISFTTHSRIQVPAIAKWVRETLPGAHITLGGHHVTSAPYDTLESVDTDSAVLGDGEEAMYQLCCNIAEREEKRRDLPEVIYKSKMEAHQGRTKKALLKNLDFYPWPDRDIFNSEKYNLVFPPDVPAKTDKIEYLITSRGCPYACRFCSTYQTHGGKGFRYRDIVNVVDEIEYLIQDRKCNGLYIYDDNFTTNEKRIREFVSEMKRRKSFIPFLCYGRVDSVRYDTFKLLREVGLQSISFGIESGSPKILKYLNKNINNEQTIEAVKICNDLGIIAKGTFIMGSPTETLADFEQTLKLIYKLKKIQSKFIANIGEGGLFIYPGTGIYRDAIESGVLPKDFSWFEHRPEIKQNYNVPIYFNMEVKTLFSEAPRLMRKFQIKFLFLHDPRQFIHLFRNKLKSILKTKLRLSFI